MNPSQHAFDLKLTAFASRTHAALLAEARRPVESISESHLDWIMDTLDLFIKEHRSGKDHVIPDYSETDGSYYEGEGLREPRRLR